MDEKHLIGARTIAHELCLLRAREVTQWGQAERKVTAAERALSLEDFSARLLKPLLLDIAGEPDKEIPPAGRMGSWARVRDPDSGIGASAYLEDERLTVSVWPL